MHVDVVHDNNQTNIKAGVSQIMTIDKQGNQKRHLLERVIFTIS